MRGGQGLMSNESTFTVRVLKSVKTIYIFNLIWCASLPNRTTKEIWTLIVDHSRSVDLSPPWGKKEYHNVWSGLYRSLAGAQTWQRQLDVVDCSSLPTMRSLGLVHDGCPGVLYANISDHFFTFLAELYKRVRQTSSASAARHSSKVNTYAN